MSFQARKEKFFLLLLHRNYRKFASKRKVAEMHLLKDNSAADRLTSPALAERVRAQEFSADLAPSMDHLDQLEAQSIYIFREAFARLKKIALLWSLGKDSNVMIWLARKAFFGRMPFPALHVDTGKKFPEMYRFRDHYGKEWDLDLRVEPCPPIDAVDPTLPPAARSAARKTEGLKMALGKYGFDGLIAGIRRDEEATRAKERVFSPRGLEGNWDVRDQPPEFWDQFNASPPPGAHLRIHPILHWTEADIWAYTKRENIPISRCISPRTASDIARWVIRTSRIRSLRQRPTSTRSWSSSSRPRCRSGGRHLSQRLACVASEPNGVVRH